MTTPHPYTFRLRWKHEPHGTCTTTDQTPVLHRVLNIEQWEVGDDVRGVNIPAGATVVAIAEIEGTVTFGSDVLTVVVDSTVEVAVDDIIVEHGNDGYERGDILPTGTTIAQLSAFGAYQLSENALESGTFFFRVGTLEIDEQPQDDRTLVLLNQDGYLCPYNTRAGRTWALQLYGGIPNRVNIGNSAINEGLNVSYSAWSNLDRGGMGAKDAADQSRYRYTLGLYAGDVDKVIIQPEPAQIKLAHGIGTTTADTALITGVTNDEAWAVGEPIFGSTIPADTTILSVDTGADTITLSTGVGVTAGVGVTLSQYQPAHKYSLRQVLSWNNPKRASVAVPGVPDASGIEQGDYPNVGASNSYYYITSLSKSGVESLPTTASDLVTFDDTPATKGALVTWTDSPGAVAYNIYRGPDAGTATTATLIGSVNATFKATWSNGVSYRFRDTWALPISTTTPPAAGDLRTLATTANTPLSLLIYSEDLTETTRIYVGVRDEDGPTGTDTAIGVTYAALKVTKWDDDATNSYSIPGTLQQNAASVYQNRVMLPCQKVDGTLDMLALGYDSADAGIEVKYKSISRFAADRTYADSNRRLWFASGNILYWSSDVLAANAEWTGPIYVGEPHFPIGSLIVYGGTQAEDSALFVGKGDGLFRVLNTESGPGSFAEKVSPLGQPSPYNGCFMVEHRGELYIGSRSQVLRYSLARIDGTDPNADGGLPRVLTGFALDGVSTGRHFYMLYRSPANGLSGMSAATSYQQVLESKEGASWHQIHHSYVWVAEDPGDDPLDNPFDEQAYPATEDAWLGRVLGIVDPIMAGDGTTWLYLAGGAPETATATTSDAGGNQVWKIPVRSGVEALHEVQGYSAAATYAARVEEGAAFMQFPPYTTADTSIKKTWHWVEARQSFETVPTDTAIWFYGTPLRSGEHVHDVTEDDQISAVFSDPDGRFWPPGEEERMFFPGIDDEDQPSRTEWVSEAISLRWLMIADNGVTPVISQIILASSPSNQALRRWTFNIEMALNQMLEQPGGTIYNTTAEMYAAYQQLLEYAKNDKPVVIVDPWGDQAVARVDLNGINAEQWTQVDDVTYYPEATTGTVVVTEFYPLSEE
jgi:hypothetical protein